jgi:4-hydroxy-tetrahydrodipicolinate reductase
MGIGVRRILEQPDYASRASLTCSPGRDGRLEELLQCDAVIDFSSPEGMTALAEVALKMAPATPLPAFVIGSTGWKDQAILHSLAQRTWVLASSNFSVGVLALLRVLGEASPLLQRLGYTPVLTEVHHRHKKDAPSGTARMMLAQMSPDRPESIQTHAIRAGEVIGKHSVTFYGPADEITLSHEALDRSLFARGAVDLALWLSARRGQPSPGRLISPDEYLDSVLGTKS